MDLRLGTFIQKLDPESKEAQACFATLVQVGTALRQASNHGCTGHCPERATLTPPSTSSGINPTPDQMAHASLSTQLPNLTLTLLDPVPNA